MNKILCGDCIDILSTLNANTVDLIFTSPPYANQRKHDYGGIPTGKYVDWFIERSEQFKRVLKDDGTFVLNIKEHVKNGERTTYVMDLIFALKKQGWLWTEEWIWHKSSSMPGKWPNRFRDAWERLLQFNKNKKFNMYQDEVMVPAAEATKRRVMNLGENDYKTVESSTNSGFSSRMANWVDREYVYPSNVLYLSSEPKSQGHSAVFPRSLPTFFVKLFTQEGDMVLDPFVGSGTTCVAAACLRRKYLGIDILQEHVDLAEKRINETIHMGKC